MEKEYRARKNRPTLAQQTGRYPDADKALIVAEAISVYPPGSEIWVEGRYSTSIWNQKTRTLFNELRAAAAALGLVVQESVFTENPDQKRRAWGGVRVDLPSALDEIKWTPGITFEEWSKLFAQGLPESPTVKAYARKKAQVALSRLWNDLKVAKRYDPETRELILYEYGKAPPDSWTTRVGPPRKSGGA